MATADLPSISGLTTEAKRGLLAVLLNDLAKLEPGTPTVTAAGRTYFLYEVPENARENARRFIEEMTPEEREESRRRAADTDPSHWLTPEEMLELIAADLARQDQSQSPPEQAAARVG